MKKLIYIIPGIAIVILAAVGIIYLIKNVGSTERAEIYVSEMDNDTKGLSLGMLEVSEWNRDPPTSIGFTPVNENELMSLIVSSGYYKGEMSYDGNEGYYFVKNNNAYFLYKKDGRWRLSNMYLTCSDTSDIEENYYFYHVPAPEIIFCQIGSDAPTHIQQNVDGFYERMTYSEMKGFYSNFDNGFAVCDDAEQTIKVKVYDYFESEYTQTQRIIYDFEKKDIGMITDDGSIVWARERLEEINSGT